jgi:N-acetylneuraminic acid mutarotase
VLLGMILGGALPAFAQVGSWATRAPLPTPPSPAGRGYLYRGHPAVGGGVYAVGGYNGTILSSVQLYTPPATMAPNGTWTTKASLPTAMLDGTIQAANGGRLYAIGGTTTAPGGAVTTVLEYDPGFNTWTPKAPMPTARRSLASAVVNGKIYAISGVDATNVVTAVVEVYDPVMNTWSTVAPMPMPRQHLTAEAVNGKIYTFGGTSSPTLVHEYDPIANTWTAKTSMPLVIDTPNSAALNGVIYMLGGNGSTTVLFYNPANDSWTGPLASMPTFRELAVTGDISGKLYVIGGVRAGAFSNVNEEFTPPTAPPPDSDFDGVPDATDNCPFVANTDQADGDGDGVGDVCDNCPNDFNPAQSDGDANGIGDVCDSGIAATLTLSQVKLKASKTGFVNGTILVRGVLDTTSYGPLADDLAGDFTVAVTGVGLATREKMEFVGTSCLIVGKVTRCIGTRGEVADFRPQTGNLFGVTIKASYRAIPAPLTGATPAAVTLTLNDLDRRTQIGNCVVPKSGKSANCRQ